MARNFTCDDARPVEPNPDVAGIGVIIGFLGTAYMTLTIVYVYYMIDYVSPAFMSSIDRGCVDFIWRKRPSKPTDRWEPILRSAILMFSDQQMMTGIALLVSGYAQLANGVSSYHWQVIVYLTWFSSITHLTTLTFLREHFRTNPEVRLWRVILMFLMLSMLGVAFIPTGDAEWFSGDGKRTQAGLPALCYFKRLGAATSERYTFESEQFLSMLFSQILLFLSYLTRLVKVSGKATVAVRLCLRTKPGNLLKRSLRTLVKEQQQSNFSWYWRLKLHVLLVIYMFLKASFDVYESTIFEVLWLSFALAWGTMQLKSTRDVGADDAADNGAEDIWGFGQLLPVVLLFLPLLSIGQEYLRQRRKTTFEESHVSNVRLSSGKTERMTHRTDQLLRECQWASENSLDQTAHPGPEQTKGTARRTGSDLQNEEIRIDSIDSQPQSRHSVSADGDNTTTAYQSNEIDVVNSGGMNNGDTSSVTTTTPTTYHFFQWFPILIGMMLAITLSIFINILVMIRPSSAATPNAKIVRFWVRIIQLTVFGVESSLLYVVIFVILGQNHGKLGIFFEKHFGICRSKQRLCLHILAYIYPCVVILIFALKIPFAQVFPVGSVVLLLP